jgi:hypothetical protein
MIIRFKMILTSEWYKKTNLQKKRRKNRVFGPNVGHVLVSLRTAIQHKIWDQASSENELSI